MRRWQGDRARHATSRAQALLARSPSMAVALMPRWLRRFHAARGAAAGSIF
jgi:hypothetical protein